MEWALTGLPIEVQGEIVYVQWAQGSDQSALPEVVFVQVVGYIGLPFL